MDRHTVMMSAARKAMEAVLNLRAGETLLVITDFDKKAIGQAFLDAGRDLGAEADLFMLPEEDRPLVEIPAELLERLRGRDVIITAFSGRAEETPFRVALINRVMSQVCRLGHGPGISEDMLIDGPMNVDYEQITDQARRLIAAFRNARYARITSPGGTDLKIYIERRPFLTDLRIEPGTWGNLPAGEVWCAAEESRSHGVLICDACVGDLGPVPSPVRIDIVDGRMVRVECADLDFASRIIELTSLDAQASVLGELGIGLNCCVTLTGNMLADEKCARTAHLAFGNNADMPGGLNRSLTHRDFLFHDPTIRVVYTDQTTRILVKNGRIQA